MTKAPRNRLLLLSFLMAGAATLTSQTQPDLPAGQGRAVLEHMCTRCHGLNVITGQRMNAQRWSDEVHDMISRGAVGSDDDVKTLVTYLAANFGNGRASQTRPSSASAEMGSPDHTLL